MVIGYAECESCGEATDDNLTNPILVIDHDNKLVRCFYCASDQLILQFL